MVSLWKSLKKPVPGAYQLDRLVDSRRLAEVEKSGLHVICDIDKTYLETEFENLLRMARIAFEAAADKVTVSGAAEVLLALRWGDLGRPLPADGAFPRPLHFVSSSPPQLRAVLEEKLTMDGLDWTSDTFKNQAYNIRMRRMDLLRQHVAYKSLAILNLVGAAAPGASFILVGDNAEFDAFIYAGIRLLLSGQLSRDGYRTYLEIFGVEPHVAHGLLAAMPEVEERHVAAILIRNVPGYVYIVEPPLTDGIRTFDNFYQAALVLMAEGLLPASRLWPLTRSFHNHYGLTQRQLAAMLRVVVDRCPGSPAQDAADDALRRLTAGSGGAEDPPAALVQSLTVDAQALDALSEKEILRHARLWMQRKQALTGKK